MRALSTRLAAASTSSTTTAGRSTSCRRRRCARTGRGTGRARSTSSSIVRVVCLCCDVCQEVTLMPLAARCTALACWTTHRMRSQGSSNFCFALSVCGFVSQGRQSVRRRPFRMVQGRGGARGGEGTRWRRSTNMPPRRTPAGGMNIPVSAARIGLAPPLVVLTRRTTTTSDR